MKNLNSLFKSFLLISFTSILLSSCFFVEVNIKEKKDPDEKFETTKNVFIKEIKYDRIQTLKKDFNRKNFSFNIPSYSKIDTIIFDSINKNISIKLNSYFAEQPFRPENTKIIKDEFSRYLGKDFKDFSINVIALNENIENLIPNFYRDSYSNYDDNRILKAKKMLDPPIKTNLSKNLSFHKGLQGKNIVLWHSHGWYYNNDLDRWEWQRPRLFQSVEDLGPLSFTLPYIIPMLENAGANVFVPRERDFQLNEVIIDNDSKEDTKSKYFIEKINDKKLKSKLGDGAGFKKFSQPLKDYENPFQNGTHRVISTDTKQSASYQYIPNIPETGTYSVYISYRASESNTEDAKYSVYHLGGKTNFSINQKAGGNTWIFLGFFNFKKGYNPELGKVEISNESKTKGQLLSIDAVRFGGGFGVVERNGIVSNRPKFTEGARYYLQFLGMPDTLVYSLNKNKNDYRDDYQSRNEYANYLTGAPYGPNKNRNEKGLNIPIDLTLAFHTDAGVTTNDTVVGTLSIYSLEDFKGERNFPDGASRLANRDLADILQTEICNDIKVKYDKTWSRRQLRSSDYAESVRPNIPSVLLELLSHQNLVDMKFMNDPRFRFDVSRSIYKAFVKFIASQNKTDYVIAPLPVDHLKAEFDANGNGIVEWKDQIDPQEPTAKAKSYMIYTRLNDGGFDNGKLVNENKITLNKLKNDVIYSFKVTAVNDGGESMPSEIVSIYKNKKNPKPFLIVNGFDRICAPYYFDSKSFGGFINEIDAGVPDRYQLNFTGKQFDFVPKSDFITNDSPGWGNSKSDYETKIIAGNTFDFIYEHGKILAKLGYSFNSCSDEVFENKSIDYKKYKFIDFIYGEEKKTNWQTKFADSLNGIQFSIFTEDFKNNLQDYLQNGGNIFISGSYIAYDAIRKNNDSTDIKFVQNVLKYKWGSNYSSNDGIVSSFKNNFGFAKQIKFNTELNDKIYQVESPGGIDPTKESEVLMRYNQNQFNAVIGSKDKYGVVASGFPFETIIDENSKVEFLKAVLKYLKLN